MGFLQAVQKDLEQSLAEQRRAALIVVLRQRASTMTFDELRQLLGSPLGKGLAAVKLGEVFASLSGGGTDETTAKASSKKAKPAQSRAEKPAKKATKKQSKRGHAPPEAAKPAKSAKVRQATATKASSTPRKKRGKPGRPPGLSPTKAAAVARYDEKVLGLIRTAGAWVASSDLHPHAGGTIEQLRLALRKLQADGVIVRRGERRTTQYHVAQPQEPRP